MNLITRNFNILTNIYVYSKPVYYSYATERTAKTLFRLGGCPG